MSKARCEAIASELGATLDGPTPAGGKVRVGATIGAEGAGRELTVEAKTEAEAWALLAQVLENARRVAPPGTEGLPSRPVELWSSAVVVPSGRPPRGQGRGGHGRARGAAGLRLRAAGVVPKDEAPPPLTSGAKRTLPSVAIGPQRPTRGPVPATTKPPLSSFSADVRSGGTTR